MVLVVTLWVLAMVSGLSWARIWTGLLSGATVLAGVLTWTGTVTHWTGWVQVSILGLTPWLLDRQRTRYHRILRRYHGREAEQMARLSETARRLLSLETSNRQAEARLSDMGDVYHVTKETSRALHVKELFDSLLEVAPNLLQITGLRLIECANGTPKAYRAQRRPDGQLAFDSAGELVDLERALIERAKAAGQGGMVAAGDLAGQVPDGVTRLAWMPLLREQRTIGVLVAEQGQEGELGTLVSVANQLSLQLSRIHLYRQVEALAVTDALTGLFVRAHCLELAKGELERSIRHDLAFTILMVDLDHFKQKNDTYGHLVGDVVLKEVAGFLKHNLREIDLIGRYGGEEFILLLVETDVEQGLPIAERLKHLVAVHPIRAYDELLSQTVSIGVSGFPGDGNTLDHVIRRADEALYAAKRAGRNRVVLATPRGPSAAG